MAYYCEKCGEKLQEGARFCTACGAPIRREFWDNSQEKQTVKKVSVREPQPEKAPVSTKESKASVKNSNKFIKSSDKTAVKTKKRMPFVNKFLLLVLVAEIIVCLFWYPGLLIKRNEQQPEFIGEPTNSPALDIKPVDGMRIKAPAGALYDDTKFTVTAIEEYNERIAALDNELKSNGSYLFAAYDIDGGLEEGVRFPGEYEVSIDLEKAGIPESLYSWLHIGRLCDAGDIWEYPYEINGHTLTYRSDENSWIVILGVPVIITGGIMLAKQSHDAKYGFFKGNSPVKTFSNPYGTYTVQWNMKYMDPDQQPTIDRMKEISEKWQKQAEEDFAEEDKVKQASSGSFAWFFKRNTPVADRLKQYLEKDQEYIELNISIMSCSDAVRVGDAFSSIFLTGLTVLTSVLILLLLIVPTLIVSFSSLSFPSSTNFLCLSLFSLILSFNSFLISSLISSSLDLGLVVYTGSIFSSSFCFILLARIKPSSILGVIVSSSLLFPSFSSIVLTSLSVTSREYSSSLLSTIL